MEIHGITHARGLEGKIDLDDLAFISADGIRDHLSLVEERYKFTAIWSEAFVHLRASHTGLNLRYKRAAFVWQAGYVHIAQGRGYAGNPVSRRIEQNIKLHAVAIF